MLDSGKRLLGEPHMKEQMSPLNSAIKTKFSASVGKNQSLNLRRNLDNNISVRFDELGSNFENSLRF